MKDPSVGFLIAGLDCVNFGFYQFSFCLFIVVIVISISHFTNFNPTPITGESLIAIGQERRHFKDDCKISVWPLKNCIETPSMHSLRTADL